LNPDSKSRADLRRAETYRYWTDVTIRFSDEDRMGHVNNAAYLTWLETCRVDYLYSLFQPDDALDVVLARLVVDYIEEARYPGTVRVGGALSRLGNRSVTSVYGVFRDDRCLATAEAVNVFFDPRSRSSTSPPATLRATIEAEIGVR
jgi:acyl-CoA thioester hydrolase